MAQSFVFWRGYSPVDAAPLIAVATMDTDNPKTGDMVQTWILREDMSPLDAVAGGHDISNCGGCMHRGVPFVRKRSCYVTIANAPMAVWKSYKRGIYFDLSNELRTVQELVRGRLIRIGAYGDPAMLPSHVWHSLLLTSAGRTGYTHQWREPFAEDYRALVMASVESPEEQIEASAAGWRTFRVRRPGEPLGAREFECPASEEGGKRETCATCQACDGSGRAGKSSPSILAHGSYSVNFIAMPKRQEVAAAATV
jgi:hypothetical protein